MYCNAQSDVQTYQCTGAGQLTKLIAWLHLLRVSKWADARADGHAGCVHECELFAMGMST